MDDTYLQQCLDRFQSLPSYVVRDLNLIKELDTRYSHMINQIDVKTNSFMQNQNQLSTISDLFGKLNDLRNECVELSNHSYELIDKHIRQLDRELHQIKQQLDEMTRERNARKTRYKPIHNNRFNCEHFIYQTKPIIKKCDTNGTNHLLEIDCDERVDPNEPVYCFCHEVYYGEMIKCDNDYCENEWFHFGCVQITSKPKGEWFCRNCQQTNQSF